MSSSWCKLKSMGFKFFPSPIKLNDNKFAIAPSRWLNHDTTDGIYAYDTTIDDWNKIIDYPKSLTTNSHSALYDNDANAVYICNAQGMLLKFDITAQTMKVVAKKGKFGSYPGFLLIDDLIHIFGRNYHKIYSPISETLTDKVMPDGVKFIGRTAVYLESKRMALIFSVNERIWTLSDDKWNVINIKAPTGIVAIAATSDEMYLIMIKSNYEIFIYDIEQNTLSLSKIRVPTSSYDKRVIIMNGIGDRYKCSLLTFGFVRGIMEELLPDDIMNIIANWIGDEYLYLLETKQDGCHWRIPLEEILQIEESKK